MATLELPTLTDGTAHYSFRTRLDDEDYVFDFRFGERRQAWHFDMATLGGTVLVKGQMVTVATNLLKRVSNETRPPGVLWAINERPGADGSYAARPGLRDLGEGGRCKLLYTEAVET